MTVRSQSEVSDAERLLRRRARVFPRGAGFDGGALTRIGGCDVAELAAEYGTPLYVLDAQEMLTRMREYRKAFPGWDIAYASKALCVGGVLQLAVAEGLHIDVASAGELATAERAGVPGARIILHGNNKSEEELELAYRVGVGRIVVDSFDELRRLGEVSWRHDHTFDILLRVKVGVRPDTHKYLRTGDEHAKFGFATSAGQAAEAVATAAKLPGVRLRGVHGHVGSQIIMDSKDHELAAGNMIEFLAHVRDRLGVHLDELNVGGGLGIDYSGTLAPVATSIGRYADAVRGSIDSGLARFDLPPLRLTVEPGRSIVGPAGVTLYRVGTVKRPQRLDGLPTIVSVDGGMSDNLRPALYEARHMFAPASPVRTERTEQVTIVGKHCESGDFLGRDVVLPADMRPGDLLAMASTGAYTHAMASNYNRLPRPAMVLVDNGRVHLLVRRETLDDVLGRDQLLDLDALHSQS